MELHHVNPIPRPRGATENNEPNSQVVTVPFHGRLLHTVMVSGDPQVVLKPTLEAMGLDFEGQRQKLARKSWATTCVTPVVADDGRTRDMVTIDLDTWSMLLANLDENRVSSEVRPMVIMYQRESARALRDYWTKGLAVNPRYSLQEQAEVLTILRPIVDAGWLETKARQVAGRALGELPEYDTATMPLTVSTYLDQLGLKRAEISKVCGKFGKSMKAAYRTRYGHEPPTMSDLVNRHMVPVAQYQEQHRPMFDEVWRSMNRDAAPGRPPNRGANSRP